MTQLAAAGVANALPDRLELLASRRLATGLTKTPASAKHSNHSAASPKSAAWL